MIKAAATYEEAVALESPEGSSSGGEDLLSAGSMF